MIALLVAVLLGQKGSGGASPVAEVCGPGGSGAEADCRPSATSSTPAAGGGVPPTVSAEPGSKRTTPRPSTAGETGGTAALGVTGATGSGSGGSEPGTTGSRDGRPGGTHPQTRPTRPRGGQEPALDLRLPHVPVPTCIVGCR
ncbi:hypothetical protein CC117_09165 [Parafrankia colletiae]|uniref:Uncharacterized protein n=1 Tax=Parafrankia colletiae TaxID=573497 RepID=A0A1S1RJG2_9ACTN|nr:hypothetical protein CC117_09165 [Parafrankia colletiae]